MLSVVAEEMAWPNLVRPDVPLAYIDLNHAIEMARALNGERVQGPYRELYEALRTAAAREQIVVPLSFTHLSEMGRIKDPGQRADVAAVLAELSAYQYLPGRPIIARRELDAGMAKLTGTPCLFDPAPLVGSGFSYVYGRDMPLLPAERIAQLQAVVEETVLNDHLLDLARYREELVLKGPSDAEAEVLKREHGYAPDTSREELKSRLAFELDGKATLDAAPSWRRGRLRDWVTAREVIHEWTDAVKEVALARWKAGLGTVAAADPEAYRALIAAMPQNQVSISIKTRYHRNPNHGWTTNDISDIDALSVAFAYCDVVFTDKAARSALLDSTELRGFTTFVPRTPTELLSWAQNLG